MLPLKYIPILTTLTTFIVHSVAQAIISSVQFSSVAQSCPTLCDPMNHNMPGLLVHHQLPEFTQTYIHWISDAIQPSHLLSSPSPPAPIPPSIRVFSNESTLRMRWPKYWSFSFSIIPSKEIPGLISLQSKGFSSLLQHHSLKASIILLCCPSTKTPVWGAVTLTLDQKIALCVHPTRKGIISPPVSFALPIPGVWETQLFF